MIQDKIFFDEKDPTGLSYNTPFTFYGSYQGRLWSKSPSGSIQYYTQNSDLSAYATTGSNQFSGSQTVTGSLTVTGTITGTVAGTTATASYVEYTNVANKPALISGSAQIASFGIFATTGSNGFNGSQSITGSLTVTGQVVAQTLNVQQVTSSIVYSSGSNVFGNSLGNTQQFTGSVGVTGSLTVAGALNGTSASFSGIVGVGGATEAGWSLKSNGNLKIENSNGTTVLQVNDTSTGGKTWSLISAGAGNAHSIPAGTFYLRNSSDSITAFQITSTGAATFSSSVRSNDVNAFLLSQTGNTTDTKTWSIQNLSTSGQFRIRALNDSETNGINAIVISRTGISSLLLDFTGAATFSSNLQAQSLTVNTADQYLQMNGYNGATTQFISNAGYSSAYNGLQITSNSNNANSLPAWSIDLGGYDFNFLNNDQFNLGRKASGGSWIKFLTIANTGAATFSSSVTLSGTNSQLLQTISNSIPGDNAAVFYNSNANSYGLYIGAGSGTNHALYITDSTRTANLFKVQGNGNVGIGTASPQTNLTIEGTNRAFPLLYNTGYGNIHIQTNETTATQNFGGSLTFGGLGRTSGPTEKFIWAAIAGRKETTSGGDPKGYLQFGTCDDITNEIKERMRITSGGYTKISNLGAYYAVGANFHELRNTIADNEIVNFSHTAASPYGISLYYTAASPNNSSNWFLYCSDSTFQRMSIRSNGGIYNYQANDVNLSDERTKKDIEPLESYWDKFKAIEIVKFKYKDQTHDDFNIGVIAQQVEAVAPEFVDVDGWGNKPELDEEDNEIVSEEEPLKSIYTADLYHATIKVLQEAMAKIETLEAEIQTLKQQ